MRRIRKKRICAGVLAAVMLFLMLPHQTVNASDLDGHWAEITMREWSDEAFLTGYDDGNYYPDANITRAEFMTLVNRIQGYIEESEDIDYYIDVPDSAWYYRTVSRAIRAGYMKGITDTQAAPEQYITRQEAATIINRLAGIDTENVKLEILKQVTDRGKIASWAKAQIAAAIFQGFLTGSEGSLKPMEYITRAEAVVLLNRKYKDIHTFTFPGTYCLGAVKNVVISSASVTLEDTVVTNDLEISVKGEGGEISLNNVKVEGRLILRGNNIKLNQDEKTEIAETVRRAAEYKDGTYVGLGSGYGGKLSVTVTIEEGIIVSAEVNKHNETPQYLRKIRKVFDEILTQQISEVDTVSGATKSSKAIIAAVEDALAQARGETTEPGQTKGSQISYRGSSKRGRTATVPERINYYGCVLEDGTYEGAATGYGGPLNLSITVEGGLITEVEINKHRETSSYFSAAKRILKTVIEDQSTDIDTVSGATKSSHAILSAVEDALKGHISKRAVILQGDDEEWLRNLDVLSEDEIMIAIQLPLISGYYTFEVTGEEADMNAKVSKASSDGTVVRLKIPKTAQQLIVANRVTGAQLFLFDIKNNTFGEPEKQGIVSWTTEYNGAGGWLVAAELLSGTADGYLFKLDGDTVELTSEEKGKTTVEMPVDEEKHTIITAYNRDGSERLGAYTIVYEDGYTSTGDDEDRVPTVSPELVADGTYESSGSGFNGHVCVSVTVENGVITAIESVEHSETLAYILEDMVIMFSNTWNTITGAILENNSTNSIDAVSGATYTSNGILDAVNNALAQGIKEE